MILNFTRRKKPSDLKKILAKENSPPSVHPDGTWVNGSSGSSGKLPAWASVVRGGRRQFALNPAFGEAGPTSRDGVPLMVEKIRSLLHFAQREFT